MVFLGQHVYKSTHIKEILVTTVIASTTQATITMKYSVSYWVKNKMHNQKARYNRTRID